MGGGDEAFENEPEGLSTDVSEGLEGAEAEPSVSTDARRLADLNRV